MKKSNDYFEMLKNLSQINADMVSAIMAHSGVFDQKLQFFSLQSELYDKLIDEFIAPIERSDIYILSRTLEDEFNAVCSFELISSYKNKNEFREQLYSLLSLMADNTAVFAELKNYKNPKRVLKLLRENKRSVNTLLTQCTKLSLSFSAADSNRDLFLTAEGYKAICAILKAAYNANNEIERIIINNN